MILERIDPLMTAVLALSLAALMLTISRGAFFATLISGIGLCLFLIRGKVSLPILIGIGVAGLLGVAILFATPMAGILARLDTLNDDATVRATIFESHFKFAINQPVFGVGLGGFNTANADIVTADNYTALAVIRAMHNVYLQWFEETGAVGLLALVLLNLSILVPMFRAAGRRSQMGGRIWGVLGGYAVFLLHGLTDYAFQEPALTLFVAAMLGCGFGISGNKTPDPKRLARGAELD
jgi:O-antigen ligase